jgi:hypothetical protein
MRCILIKNNLKGKLFISSSLNLSKRLVNYNQKAYQRRHRNSSIIRGTSKYRI